MFRQFILIASLLLVYATGLDSDEENDSRLLPKRRCEPGKFYKTSEFFAEVTNDFIYDHPEHFITANLHCAAALLSYRLMSELCACDCFTHHGSSESEVCVIDLDDLAKAPLGCVCLYTEDDKQRIPCLSQNSTGIRPPRNLALNSGSRERFFGQNRLTKCRNLPEDNERNQCMDSVCAPLFEDVKELTCSHETYRIRNYSQTITGADMCAIDCFYIHGSRKQPYGMCTTVNGRSQCVCLY